jgi:hypothetical protein
VGDLVATSYAVRVMGVWVRRADALIGNGGVANAARAVAQDRARLERDEHDLAALERGVPATQLAVAG